MHASLRRYTLLALAALALPLAAQASPVPRIVGGSDALIADFPYATALVQASSTSNFAGMFCSGSLVSAEWVMTAGHCVDWVTSPADIVAVIGQQSVGFDTSNRTVIDAIIIHPDYSFPTNDIAFVHLATPSAATPGGFVTYPATLLADPLLATTLAVATFDDIPTNFTTAQTDMVAIGFGTYDDTSSTFRPVLQRVGLDFMLRDDCDSYYTAGVPAGMFCGALNDPVDEAELVDGAGTCYGDSGGPILLVDAVAPATSAGIIGVTSFGSAAGCANGIPGGYTSVEYHRYDFIDKVMNQPEIGVVITTADLTPGDSIREFVVTVTNNSPAVTSTAFDLPLAQSTTWSFLDIAADGCSAATYSCPIPALAPGANVVFNLRVDTATGSNFVLQATSPVDDYNPDNDVATTRLGRSAGAAGDGLFGGGGGSLPAGALGLLALLALRRRR